MGYYLFHGGSADHSSEDRMRGICRLLPEPPEIRSNGWREDWRYGLAELASLRRGVCGAAGLGDWGITACPYLGAEIRKKGGRAVLWGWVPGTDKLLPSQIRQLRQFYRIILPDQQSLALLQKLGIRRSVQLGPDPSILVERRLRGLSGNFRRDTVGLCVSPAAERHEQEGGLLFRCYCHLIRWILKNTDWHIALIPYCVKNSCNDRLLQLALKGQFSAEERVFCREDGDCQVLRGDLSLCRCCVGTAGALAGWSCGVPGLCIGASGRASALERTLFGTSEEAVVRVRQLQREEDLTAIFLRFLHREDALRGWLEVSLPRCRQWAQQWQWCG
jgi:hypothetical protein